MRGLVRRGGAVALITGVVVGSTVHIAVAQSVNVQPMPAESPTITVLTGLLVPQFETEMRHFVQALGMNCGGCHTRGNFAGEDNPRKATARRMIEMTKSLNRTYFPDFWPADGESTLGRVTCYTCHQGSAQPKTAADAPPER